VTAAAGQTAFLAPAHARGISWGEVNAKGYIRERPDGKGWYVDLRPHARIFTVPGIGRLETKRDAERVLDHIRGALFRGEPMEFALATYRPVGKKPLMVEAELERWLRVQRGRAEAGDISPTYLRELERYCKPGGYLSWWFGRSVFEVQFGLLEEWVLALGERGLAPKTRRHALDAMRTFLRWEKRSRKIDAMPEFPSVPVPEHAPTLLTPAEQDAVLEAIPVEFRGAFLAMARLGLRPGEVRALDVDDYREGELQISKAVKGSRVDAPIRGTKTGDVTTLGIWDDETREWIDERVGEVTAEERLCGPIALFENPRAHRAPWRWTGDTLRYEWRRACDKVGVRCSLYEGTKHSTATNWLAAGVRLEMVQVLLRHSTMDATRHYAKPKMAAAVVDLKAAGKRLRGGE
jgi:integrase